MVCHTVDESVKQRRELLAEKSAEFALLAAIVLKSLTAKKEAERKEFEKRRLDQLLNPPKAAIGSGNALRRLIQDVARRRMQSLRVLSDTANDAWKKFRAGDVEVK